MTLKQSCELMVAALEDLKGQDIKVLDVSKLTSITDIMIIATGRSGRQVRSLADKVAEAAKADNLNVIGMEGHQQGEWILIDIGDIVVHIMQPGIREYYQLEKLWAGDHARTQATFR